MDALTTLGTLLLMFAPVNADVSSEEAKASPTAFRVQVYPYGGYYSYPPYCPPSYYYGPGYGHYRRGYSFYVGPGYPYYGYYDPRCYYWGSYYGYPYYRNRGRGWGGGFRGSHGHHRGHGGHHGGGHRH